MSAYLALKWLHVLGATVLFGTGLGTAFHFWLAHRTGKAALVAAAARSTVIADFAFTLPAAILQPLTGWALARTAGYPLDAPWILASFALYLLAGACWIPVVVLQLRMRDLAHRCAVDGTTLGPEYHKLARIWFVLGWPAFAALVIVIGLMVARPA
ncbi:MAG TPA: DUF2269 domain-containing protein [Usitatibacter sp.]|nr:DUF2269 domain-containing protein [Usitatibacter sp.]